MKDFEIKLNELKEIIKDIEEFTAQHELVGLELNDDVMEGMINA